MKKAIQSVIKLMMDRVMQKVLIEDPFLKEDHKAKKPLYAALVPDEIFIGGLGTYKAFIDAINEIGKEYKDRIYREFLGIEPLVDLDEGKL